MSITSRHCAGLFGLIAFAGVAPAALGQLGPAGAPANTPSALTLYATIRDFRPYGMPDGHPDFERWVGSTRVGLLQPQLDANGKPHAQSLTGSSITAEFRNAAGDPINPALFNASLGDTPGQLTEATDARFDSLNSFDQWYNNIPGVNVAINVPITLTRVSGSDHYVFDSATVEPFRSLGGFFPIDGQGYGNYASTGHNFSFTTELESLFTYKHGGGQTFRFSGDDDVWVFIDGRLVIDLGSVHSSKTQVVDLDRLNWLEDGHDYSLKIFHAERHTSQSNFKIDTTIAFRSVAPAAAAALAD